MAMAMAMAMNTGNAIRPLPVVRAPSAGRGPWRPWRGLLVGLGGALLLWLSLGVTLSGILGPSDPEMVLRWWPWSADANASSAAELSGEPSGSARQRGTVLARRALARQAISPVAIRALAASASYSDATDARTLRLLTYGERLSRRDAPTQLMLLELNVQRGDVAGALVHYDRAMRTSLEVRPQILPTLIAAANDPAIARPLASLLARQPSWRDDFVSRMVSHVDNPRSLAMLLHAARLSPSSPVDRNLLEQGLTRIAEQGAPDLAYRLYRGMAGRPIRAGDPVVNGDFGGVSGLKPFDWALNDDPSLLTSQENGQAGGPLHASIAAGADGWLARQMVLVSLGSYALAAHVAGPRTDGSTLTLSLRCLNGAVLLNQPWQGSSDIVAGIMVPAGCRAAWLAFEGRGPIDGNASDYVIGPVSLKRR